MHASYDTFILSTALLNLARTICSFEMLEITSFLFVVVVVVLLVC